MEKAGGIGLELTSLCNLSDICRHCYGITGLTNKKEPVQISDNVLDMLAEEIPLIFESLTITGGEPTIFPQKVNKFVSRIGLPWVLMTNGVIYEKSFKPNTVLVSLDNIDIRPGIHPEMVLKNIAKYQCDIAVNTVMSKETNLFYFYGLLKNVSQSMGQIGCQISEWKINFVVKRGLAINHPKIFAEWDASFQYLSEFLKVYFKERPFHLAIKGLFFTKNTGDEEFSSKLDLGGNPCKDCFHRSIYTTINGEEKMQLCSVARNKSMPINKGVIDAFLKITEMPELQEFSYKDWKECADCKWLALCGCGCPSMAETYTGNWTGKDIVQCKILSMAEKYLLSVFPTEIKKYFTSFESLKPL